MTLDTERDRVLQFQGKVVATTFQRRVGDSWEIEGGSRIEFRSVRKRLEGVSEDEEIYGVELHVTPGHVVAGAGVISLGSGYFLSLKKRVHQTQCIYWTFLSPDGFTYWALYLEHVNSLAGTATMTMISVQGR